MLRFLLPTVFTFTSFLVSCGDGSIPSSPETPKENNLSENLSDYSANGEMLDFLTAVSYVGNEFLDNYFSAEQIWIRGVPTGHQSRPFDAIVAAEKHTDENTKSATYTFTTKICPEPQTPCAEPQTIEVKLPENRKVNPSIETTIHYAVTSTTRFRPFTQKSSKRLPDGFPVVGSSPQLKASSATLDFLNALSFAGDEVDRFFNSRRNSKDRSFDRVVRASKKTIPNVSIEYEMESQVCIDTNPCRDPQTFKLIFPLQGQSGAYRITVKSISFDGKSDQDFIFVSDRARFPWWYAIPGVALWSVYSGVFIF